MKAYRLLQIVPSQKLCK